MPSLETLEKFIAKVESNKHDEAIEEFYTENATIQENIGEIKGGRARLVEGEKVILARAQSVESVCIRPVFVNGDYAVVRWKFTFVWKDGSRMVIEEMAHQRWEGDRIAQEQFFYDPAQRQAVKGD
jgi:hypothetical protein